MVVRSEAQSGRHRLAILAAKIRVASDSVERDIDVGRWLTEAKADEDMPRGGWHRWLEQVGIPNSTAHRCIKLFRAAQRHVLRLLPPKQAT
jgi:hypothetical protein